MVRAAGLAPATSAIRTRHSARLNYALKNLWSRRWESHPFKRFCRPLPGCPAPPANDGRGGGIRTHDLMLPKHASYQPTGRHPEKLLEGFFT